MLVCISYPVKNIVTNIVYCSVSPQSAVRSPQSAVRSPCFIPTGIGKHILLKSNENNNTTQCYVAWCSLVLMAVTQCLFSFIEGPLRTSIILLLVFINSLVDYVTLTIFSYITYFKMLNCDKDRDEPMTFCVFFKPITSQLNWQMTNNIMT